MGGEEGNEFAKGGIVKTRTLVLRDAGPEGYIIPLSSKTRSVELLLRTARAQGFGGENGDK